MIWILLLVIVTIVVLLAALVSSKPDRFIVSRSAEMAASAERIFGHVNDLEKIQEWLPWSKMDPNAKLDYKEGPRAGTSASYTWAGNSKIGRGKLSIVESRPHDLIRMRLEMVKPVKADNAIEYTLEELGGGRTRVTWSMNGQNNTCSKLIGIFVSMDKMCGSEFEKGLSSLKTIVEKPKQSTT